MTVERIGSGYQVAQTRYIESVLDRFGMTDCRPHWTPCDLGALIDELSTQSSPAADITKYREVTGSLNYLATMTRPDILYALSRLQEHAHLCHIVTALLWNANALVDLRDFLRFAFSKNWPAQTTDKLR